MARLDPSDLTVLAAKIAEVTQEALPASVEQLLDAHLAEMLPRVVEMALRDMAEDGVGAAVRDAIQQEINSYKVTVTFSSRVDGADRAE